ncbi:MAG: DUF4105 domain-containing protein [Pseudoxanthomonas suwonensis]|nr:DUF4105 domain-containing protein [Pseudoxanthomonas suwonensis]
MPWPLRMLAGILLAMLLCLAAPARAQDTAPRIGVATMLPGTIFFERFGHDALLVEDPATGATTSYNFGFFDLEEPGFLRRFIHGDMQYMLVALPFEDDLAYYRQVGRGVSVQWLDLAPGQARTLAARLADNALPQNARYRYDYFTDNCSTRVRDALDEALGGQLRRQLQVSSHGRTYRSESVRLASPSPLMALGFDIGLGPAADAPLNRWQEGFIPMRLADGLRQARLADGRPLVTGEHELLAHATDPEPIQRARPWWPWLLAGLVIAFGLRWLTGRRPRVAGGMLLPLWLLLGLPGLVMVYAWGFTEHRFAWANQNLLLFSPLCLLLLPGAVQLLRGRTPGRLLGWTLAVIALGAVLAIVQSWLLVLPVQRNAHWVALLAPIHLALAWHWRPRRFAAVD